MKKERNPSLELFRCLLMFGIVLGHAQYQCGHNPPVGSLTDWCVCGFVFMSGWFGIRFSWRKCFNLAALGVWCAMISNMICGGKNPLAAMLGAKSYGYWFLWSYIILMMFAPIIDGAIKNASCEGGEGKVIALVSPIAFLIWGWGFVSGLPFFRDYLPRPIGLGGLSFLSLIGIYMFVRVYKVLDLSRFFARKSTMLLLLPCVVLMLLKFSSFSWIISFVVSAIMFELFKRLKVPEWLGRAALFVAPSTFAIYLLHMTGGGLK